MNGVVCISHNHLMMVVVNFVPSSIANEIYFQTLEKLIWNRAVLHIVANKWCTVQASVVQW